MLHVFGMTVCPTHAKMQAAAQETPSTVAADRFFSLPKFGQNSAKIGIHVAAVGWRV
jgi:hypothetical protein